MGDETSALAHVWLEKARSDLDVAVLLVSREENLDIAVYHCQQACEKSLKGLLTAEGCAFCDEMTPYATEFRYPGDIFAPSPPESQDVLDKAKHLMEKTSALFPKK